jgi:hypothetical protein
VSAAQFLKHLRAFIGSGTAGWLIYPTGNSGSTEYHFALNIERVGGGEHWELLP